MATIIMAYNANEIDRYPTDLCPYNEAHRLHSLKQYEHHVTSCKDQFFPGVTKHTCRYNVTHIFVDVGRKEYHEPRCEGHPRRLEWVRTLTEVPWGESPRLPQYQVCPYFPYHFLVVSDFADENRINMTMHQDNCPRKLCPLPKVDTAPLAPLVPFAPVESRPCNPEIDIDIAARLASERLILHFRNVPFSVRITYVSRLMQVDKALYIDTLASPTSSQFPGMQAHTTARDHSTLLVAKLTPDPVDGGSSKAYWCLYNGLEKDPLNKVAISYQLASSWDRVWLISQKSETTGFGGCLNKGELGLFLLQHSKLLGTHSTLESLQLRTEHLAKKLEDEQLAGMDREARLQGLTQQLNEGLSARILQESAARQDLERERALRKQELKDHAAYVQSLKEGVVHDFEEQKRLLDQATAACGTLREAAETARTHALQADARAETLKTEVSALARKHDQLLNENRSLSSQKDQLEKRYLRVNETAGVMQNAANSLQEELSRARAEVEALRQENDRLTRQPAIRGRTSHRKPGDPQYSIPLCLDCSTNMRNTLFVPCGHICYCNVCLENKKILLGSSLKYVFGADKQCPICCSEIKKVHKAYLP